MTAVRVLVIDDEKEMRDMVSRVLRHAGHEVYTAEDGREALGLLRTLSVAVVVTDLVMPEMEGIEFILHLRRQVPEVKVIAMSGGGYVTPQAYLRVAANCGASRVLAKPFSSQELLDAVDGVMESAGPGDVVG